jgi:hypothetical protein
VTPVGGFAALVVDRSPEPESSAADQDRHVIELLADSLNWARREDPQIVRPTSARRGRSEDPRLLEARSSDPPALERVVFGLRRPKGTARAPRRRAISCRKSEIIVSLRHDAAALSHTHINDPDSPPGAAANQGETDRKNLSRFVPRNSLKSLDSDERIQGNPRKTNPHNRGSRSKTAGSQENPNPIERTGAGAV